MSSQVQEDVKELNSVFARCMRGTNFVNVLWIFAHHTSAELSSFLAFQWFKITLKCVSANIKVIINFFPYSLFPLVSLQHFSLTPSVWQQVTVDHVITVFPPCVCVVAVLNSTSRETQPRPIYQYRSLFDNIFISQTNHKTYCTLVYHCHLLFFILQYIL